MDNVATFMSLTGATPDVANMYLEMAGENLDVAVGLFFENGPAPTTAGSTNRPQSGTFGTGHHGLDDWPATTPDDEVRAPIPARRSNVMAELYGGAAVPGVSSSIASRPTGQESLYRSAFVDSALSSDSADPRRADLLAELFRTPQELIFVGTLDQACRLAKKQGKFVMVHLMKQGVFQSEVQNRDLWRDKEIVELIKQYFIFVQYDIQRPEGRNFEDSYGPIIFPHISILHYLTRELVLKFEVPISRDLFLEAVRSFLDSQPELQDDRPKKQAVIDLDSDEDEPVAAPPTKFLSEEEQLRLAMQASLAEVKPGSAAGAAPAAAVASASSAPTPASPAAADAFSAAPSAAVVVEALPVLENNAPDSTRVQLRLPNTAPAVVRVAKATTVRQLFAHVKAINAEAASRPFDMVVPPSQSKLSEQMDATVEGARLANASLSVVFD